MDLEAARFSGHQSFTLRNTWLPKGVAESLREPRSFSADDSLVRLGVGKNMVDAIRYWCLATRVIEDKPDERGAYQPSALGLRIFADGTGWDPYLEDVGTVWLLHWLLATNWAYATTVYYAFNELNAREFTREGLEREMLRVADQVSARATKHTIRRDVNVFVRGYVGKPDRKDHSIEDILDCPLAELKLLIEEPLGQTFAFNRGAKRSLPDAVVLYALCEYAREHSEQRTFTFDELAYRRLSPGRVFKLDEMALAERLERLEGLTGGAWQFTETAGYRQVVMTGAVDAFEALDRYFGVRESGNGSV